MKISQQKIHKFQTKILSYYKKNKRDLPWRNTTNPYEILVSELMLQQTQVNRVITYYTQWIARWPTIKDLAEASRKDVLKSWMGLGYNSRGINLHKAAQKIANDYNGNVLEAMKQYSEIPGVGLYTSRAVQIFSTNADVVTVDTNIRRIFIHEFHLQQDTSDKDLFHLAERCLPKGQSRDWHNALMDYGAQYLTSRKTGISPRTKQSSFQGSDRQIRGKILRILLKKPVTFENLQNEIKTDKARLHLILDKLTKESIIYEEKKMYYLKE